MKIWTKILAAILLAAMLLSACGTLIFYLINR